MASMTVGERFPAYRMKAVKPGKLAEIDAQSPEDYFEMVDSADHSNKWRVILFYPKDFSFVCPTELCKMAAHYKEFSKNDAVVFAVSTDNEYSHYFWRRDNEDLIDVPYPLASDLDRKLSTTLGVLTAEGVCMRACYIVDPEGIIRSVNITDENIGRSLEEVARQLDALMDSGLFPCDWQRGERTIDILAALQARENPFEGL